MKILLYKIEKEVDELAKEIQELQEVTPLISSDLVEAKKILKQNKIALIIAGVNDNSSNELFDFIAKTSTNTPFIWYTATAHDDICVKEFYEINSFNRYLDLSTTKDEILNTIRNIILKKENVEVSKFVRIDLNRIVKHDTLSADVYVKLSDNKVVKIINKNGPYDKNQVLNYKGKVKYLYVKTSDYPGMIKKMYQSLKTKLKNNATLDAVVDAQLEGIQMVKENILNFSIDAQTEKMLNEITSSCIETMQNIKSLKSLFVKFMKDKKGYLHRHSLMISYLTSLAALKMNWNTESTLQKLTIAGILHDVSLRNDEEAKIDTIEEIETCDISSQDKQRIKMHSLETADVVRNMNEIPPDVDSIILTHHELPNGKGFPRGLVASQVSQIAALFIIGEKFINSIYNQSFNKDDCSKVIDELKDVFDKGNYKRPYYAFKDMIETFCN